MNKIILGLLIVSSTFTLAYSDTILNCSDRENEFYLELRKNNSLHASDVVSGGAVNYSEISNNVVLRNNYGRKNEVGSTYELWDRENDKSLAMLEVVEKEILKNQDIIHFETIYEGVTYFCHQTISK